MTRFKFDNKIKNEALNFATIMNATHHSDQVIDKYFTNLENQNFDVSIPLIDNAVLSKYEKIFSVNRLDLCNEYRSAKKYFEKLLEKDVILKKGTKEYPDILNKELDMPRFIYLRGKISLIYDVRAVSIVGSRQASNISKKNTRALTNYLGSAGITIVSGLAKGIDVTAHIEALDKGYNTIAVIGTSINNYYPLENADVQKRIEEHGLIVSQFSPASKTQRHFFPLRNKLMSALTLATVVMEAGETSGALIQVDYAMKQNRMVFIPQEATKLKDIEWPLKYRDKGAHIFKKNIDVIKSLSKSKLICFLNNKENNNIFSDVINESSFPV